MSSCRIDKKKSTKAVDLNNKLSSDYPLLVSDPGFKSKSAMGMLNFGKSQ